MGPWSKVTGTVMLVVPGLYCGLAVAYVLGLWGLPAGLIAFQGGYALMTRLPRRGIMDILTDRPRVWTVLKLLYYYGGLALGHFAYLEAARFGVVAAVCFLLVFTYFVIQRLIMPSFLAMPATDVFVPYLRTPERAVDDSNPMRSGVVVFAVLVSRLAGLVMLFSTWTVFWWSRSMIQTSSAVPRGPRDVLLMAEQTYSWFTFHAIPFLSVPETFGWVRPAYFSAGAASALALAFKILVVLPMIATLVYFVRGVWEKPPGSLDDDAPTPWTRLTGRAGDGPRVYYVLLWIGQVCFVILAVRYFFGGSVWWYATGLVYLVVRIVWNYTADATSFITFRRNPYGVGRLLYFLAGLALAPFAFLQASTEGILMAVVAVAAVAWIAVMRLMMPLDIAMAQGRVLVPYFRAPDKRDQAEQPLRSAPLVLLVFAGRLGGLLTLFSVLTAFLASRGWISAPAGATSLSAVLSRAANVYAWQAADVLPVLEVPDTIGWPQPAGFAGTAAQVLLLLFKLLVLLPIATSLVYLLRGLWERRPVMAETVESGPPVPWTRTTGGWEEYLLRRQLYVAQQHERVQRRREHLQRTASQLDGMSVDDICEHSQVAIEAARARARLAKSSAFTARHDPALRDTLVQFAAVHDLFADVVEGDLRRRRVRARADGGRPASLAEMAEYRIHTTAALKSVVRVTTELHAGWPEAGELLGTPSPEEPVETGRG